MKTQMRRKENNMAKNECFEWERLTLKDKVRLFVARLKAKRNGTQVYQLPSWLLNDNTNYDDEEIII